jgi:HK97 family phage prohead protease
MGVREYRRAGAGAGVYTSKVGTDPPAGLSSPVIAGYAARFWDQSDPGTVYQLVDGFYERLHPQCFDRALSERQNVRGLLNHNPDCPLGRSTNSTLTLSTDSRGLLYQLKPPGSTIAHDAVAAIRAGIITGSSFAFVVRGQRLLKQKDGTIIRELQDVDLFDVGPVTYPAYIATTAGVRSRFVRPGSVLDQNLRAKHTLYETIARCAEIESDLL